MIVTGEITLPAPREIVFQVLQNAPFFASCVEGVRDLKEIDATHYDAVLDTKVAYMNFTFKVSVEVTRLSPPERIEVTSWMPAARRWSNTQSTPTSPASSAA
jgi:uncharacterized protein